MSDWMMREMYEKLKFEFASYSITLCMNPRGILLVRWPIWTGTSLFTKVRVWILRSSDSLHPRYPLAVLFALCCGFLTNILCLCRGWEWWTRPVWKWQRSGTSLDTQFRRSSPMHSLFSFSSVFCREFRTSNFYWWFEILLLKLFLLTGWTGFTWDPHLFPNPKVRQK